MNIGPRCVQVAEHLDSGADHALPAHLESHVDGCTHCAALVRDAIDLAGALEAGSARYQHPANFEARLAEAINDEAGSIGIPKRPVFLSP